ncbi:MAG: hypothetical protein ABR508_07675 [Candidatus Baltobacteraceae bacterium]
MLDRKWRFLLLRVGKSGLHLSTIVRMNGRLVDAPQHLGFRTQRRAKNSHHLGRPSGIAADEIDMPIAHASLGAAFAETRSAALQWPPKRRQQKKMVSPQ